MQKHKMRPTVVTHVPLSVFLLATTVRPPKTAEPVEVLFGIWALVESRNRVTWGLGSPGQGGFFERKHLQAYYKVQGIPGVPAGDILKLIR